MSLARYRAKRSFPQTPEPPPRRRRASPRSLRFVVQKHHARRLHYDVRFEHHGVLLSWAVPKGPSMNPDDRRLAIQTEDHPYDYKDFEGVIPPGNYGAGSVIVWDEGTYEGDFDGGLERGHVRVVLHGTKLKGAFSLVRTGDHSPQWLLMKQEDEFASGCDVTRDDWSVKTATRNEELEGRAVPMPHDMRPMLANTADAPFDRAGWLFELKWDGYRALAEVDGERVRLYSRRGQSFNEQFAPIVRDLAALKQQCVLDGEVVMLDAQGVSRFQLLQNFLETGESTGVLAYVIFDLLYLDGKDIRGLPLRERKRLLRQILPPKHPRLRFSSHIEDRGASLFLLTQEKGLEGIVAKDAESRYREGRRTSDWLKIRTRQRQEAIICGYTEGRESRQHFGALILGVHEGGGLRYIGLVGTGFSDASLAALHRELQKLRTPVSPFPRAPKTATTATWVKPQLVCEVEFQEWTGDGRMRKPVFLGLRRDKLPREVRREQEEHMTGDFSNLDKVYWPDEGYTKRDLLAYYDKVAHVILPYLKDRPESMLRHPDGIAGESFYQKNVDEHLPAEAQTIVIPSDHRPIRYLLCQNRATLLYMANFGCIELNPWHARIDNLDNPDYLVIDLDPHGVPFDAVVTTARMVHKVLDELELPNLVKTSGKSGLHIYVPLGAAYVDDIARQFAELVCKIVHQRLPEMTTMERRLDKRPKAVYLDYLQNRHGQTLAAAYCVRPVPGATVSAPLKWSEVRKGLDPKKFTIKSMPSRIKKVGDLWQGVLGPGADILAALDRLKSKRTR